MAVSRRLQVFVSSTYTDMIDERKAAVEAILEAGDIPAGMELFTAGDVAQWDLIKKWIEDSDVYCLIAGGRYGSVNPKTKRSYTEMEFDYAKRLGKPRFSLIASDSFIAEKRKKRKLGSSTDSRLAKKFRGKAAKSKVVNFFDNRDQIKAQILRALQPVREQPGVAGWVKGTADPSPLLFPATWRVGHGYLPDVEISHSYASIKGMLWDKKSSTLRIGSPYMRYWAYPPPTPRLQWLLENTKEIKVEVALFMAAAPDAEYSQHRDEALTKIRDIAKAFPNRLSVADSPRPSDISYITYPLGDTDGKTSRAMIGLQTPSYEQRPFVELVYTSLSAPPLVLAAEELHRIAFS